MNREIDIGCPSHTRGRIESGPTFLADRNADASTAVKEN
jgi:hypothetical protein